MSDSIERNDDSDRDLIINRVKSNASNLLWLVVGLLICSAAFSQLLAKTTAILTVRQPIMELKEFWLDIGSVSVSYTLIGAVIGLACYIAALGILTRLCFNSIHPWKKVYIVILIATVLLGLVSIRWGFRHQMMEYDGGGFIAG